MFGKLPKWLAAWCWIGLAGLASAEEQEGAFRFADVSATSLGLWEGGQPVLVYNHGLISPTAGRSGRPRESYIHPLYGLEGEVLTDDFPADHTYHRGVYWAWPHVKIGEQEYDQWSLRSLPSEFKEWTVREVTENSATLSIENGWFVEGTQVVREQVTIVAHRKSAGSRAVDVELTWTPLDKPVTLWGAEGKSYGGFNFRFARPHRPVLTTPAGRLADDVVVTRLPWVDYVNSFGDQAGQHAEQLSGSAIFVHPGHRDFPPEWMARHYGLVSAGWPGVSPQRIAAGEPLTLRYRLWIHRGQLEAAEIQRAYDVFAGQTAQGAAESGTGATAWKLDRLDSIGGHAARAVGAPRVVETPQGKAIEFDGQRDGLLVDVNPLAGLAQFTAEVIFRPSANGPKEQRFWHMQEAEGDNRLLFETRLTDDGQWYLDTFAKSGEASATLLARDFPHPIGPWYHAAVTYDGASMRHFVNGKEELQAAVKLAPLKPGQTSLGVRQNRVSWYRGAIRQVRVTPRVLAPAEFLQP